MGFLTGGSEHPPHQLGGVGERCKLPQRGKFGFWSILGPQKSRQNGQLAFVSGRATSESEGQVPPCPNLARTAPAPDSPDLNPVDYAVWGALQQQV